MPIWASVAPSGGASRKSGAQVLGTAGVTGAAGPPELVAKESPDGVDLTLIRWNPEPDAGSNG